MPIHSATDPDHKWPLSLPPASREHLQIVMAARRDATASWKARHKGSRQEFIPHGDFLSLIGVDVHPSVFSRLIGDRGYPVATAQGFLESLAAGVMQWRAANAAAQRLPDGPIHVFPWWNDMADAAGHAAALEERGIQERGVAFLAPTGHGKTFMARWLKQKIGRAAIVSARESWRSSYFAALSDVLSALGQRPCTTARKAEQAAMDYLKHNKITLILDEQDFFGRSALNMIRQFLNETRASVVLLMVPETWDRMVRDGSEYASQVCRRCPVVMRPPLLSHKEASLFLQASLPGLTEARLRPAAAVMADAANRFGGLSLLDHVAGLLPALGATPDNLESLARQASELYRTRHRTSLEIPRNEAAA